MRECFTLGKKKEKLYEDGSAAMHSCEINKK